MQQTRIANAPIIADASLFHFELSSGSFHPDSSAGIEAGNRWLSLEIG
jgi:hypothetical protein